MLEQWAKTSRHRFVLLFAMLAAGVYLTPLQKYMTLSRFQHWGMAIGLLGVGYLLQSIWSWNTFSRWARIAHLSSAFFWLVVGFTFYSNPWLDTRMSAGTHDTEISRSTLMIIYLVLFLYLGIVYAKWAREEDKVKLNKEQQEEQQKNQQKSEV
jgi:Ca2+/Na+ antiporter